MLHTDCALAITVHLASEVCGLLVLDVVYKEHLHKSLDRTSESTRTAHVKRDKNQRVSADVRQDEVLQQLDDMIVCILYNAYDMSCQPPRGTIFTTNAYQGDPQRIDL